MAQAVGLLQRPGNTVYIQQTHFTLYYLTLSLFAMLEDWAAAVTYSRHTLVH
jgi:hypothetical protein